MRRLPVYLLLDTSASMRGEPIEAVKEGVRTLVSTLRNDPYALETVYISIITFNTTAQQVSPLTELYTFREPVIEAGGRTALGAALELLSQRVDNEVVKTTAKTKGDWKPLVFLMTDGAPTGGIQKGLSELKKCQLGMVIACAAGPRATSPKNIKTLKRITENVVQLDFVNHSSIKAFFKWVSASVSISSKSVEAGTGETSAIQELPPPLPLVNIFI